MNLTNWPKRSFRVNSLDERAAEAVDHFRKSRFQPPFRSFLVNLDKKQLRDDQGLESKFHRKAKSYQVEDDLLPVVQDLAVKMAGEALQVVRARKGRGFRLVLEVGHLGPEDRDGASRLFH